VQCVSHGYTPVAQSHRHMSRLILCGEVWRAVRDEGECSGESESEGEGVDEGGMLASGQR
jgi:hypothetical protein